MIMNSLLILVWLILFGSVSVTNGQSDRPAISVADSTIDIKQEKLQMQLSTTVVKQEYCDSDHVRFKLRLRLANVGAEPIILYRYSLAITQSMVSRSLESAATGRYVEHLTPYVDPVLPEPANEATPDTQLMVTLRPAESYEIDVDFHLSVFDGSKETSDFLRPGNYFLRIRVPTWYWGQEKAVKLRDRWREYGFLWTRDLTSLPMPFNVAKNRRTVKCD
jgi:hypothetical protein